jgi:Leucine-rich repeat (LRR) protein
MLSRLQVLWLADNYISSLTGISALQQLQQLNLARNDISSIGSSLLSHTALTSLNLADNKISNFQASRCLDRH